MHPAYDSMAGLVLEFKDAHTGHAAFCMFNPTRDLGHVLVSSGQDSAVCLFDTRARARLAVLQGHTNAVFSAVFSPDGSLLASSSQDESAIVWAPVPIALALARPVLSERGLACTVTRHLKVKTVQPARGRRRHDPSRNESDPRRSEPRKLPESCFCQWLGTAAAAILAAASKSGSGSGSGSLATVPGGASLSLTRTRSHGAADSESRSEWQCVPCHWPARGGAGPQCPSLSLARSCVT
eukprot:1154002-Rhodomonas_salina.1